MEGEEYDLVDSESIPVVGVENFNIARDVIKSLRSSSNSSRFYKQNAARDNFLIEDLEEFNKVVSIKATTFASIKAEEDRINDSITKFKPPIRYIVPKHTSTNSGKILYNPGPVAPSSTSREYDDFSSDEDLPKTSPGKMCKSPKYDDEDEYDLKGDSSDEDNDSWNESSSRRNKHKKDYSPPQNNLPKVNNYQTSVAPARTSVPVDDDLDFGEEDDADNAELFSSFIAPVSSSSKNTNYNDSVTGKLNFSSTANTSSLISSSSKKNKFDGTVNSSTTSNSKSVGKGGGSAGIRGIQELLKDPNAYNSRNQSPAVNNLLSAIKPGQAIRVKAPGKRRNLNNSSEY